MDEALDTLRQGRSEWVARSAGAGAGGPPLRASQPWLSAPHLRLGERSWLLELLGLGAVLFESEWALYGAVGHSKGLAGPKRATGTRCTFNG